MVTLGSTVIDHDNWDDFEYEEEFTFSAGGKNLYIKRTFKNGQALYWVYDAEGYPLDEGQPSSARAYAAVNRTKR